VLHRLVQRLHDAEDHTATPLDDSAANYDDHDRAAGMDSGVDRRWSDRR
jgi:hypothetical protein